MTDYEQDYFNFCVEAMLHGYTIRSGGRQMLKYQGRQVPLARAVWNFCYPNDPVLSTEVIHHKDSNRMNDSIGNLEKMDAGLHMKLHIEKPVKTRYKTKQKVKKPKKSYYERIYPEDY